MTSRFKTFYNQEIKERREREWSMSSKIQDIAKLAGVSPATVSLALNDKPGVSLTTKRKIQQLAKQMNYVPNRLAQGLQGGKSNNVLVFMSGPQYDYFNSPFYFETLKHLSRGLSESPYHMMLQIATADMEQEQLQAIAAGKGYDAAVFMGLRMPLDTAVGIMGESKPLVFVNRPCGELGYSVNADYAAGMELLTRHLIRLGHKDIAFIGYSPKLASSELRMTGFRRAFAEAGLPVPENRVYYADYYQESGYLAMRKLIQSGAALPSAVIGGNDLIAIGALEALLDAGLRVPEDISVAGVDNIPNTHLLKVPLTTVHVAHDAIGFAAAQAVIGLLDGNNVERETWVDVSLVQRQSTSVPGGSGSVG